MDVLGLINIPTWIVTILLFFLTLYLYTLWKHSLWRRLGIPGPTPFPFLGNMKEFATKGVTKSDQELVKKYGDVVGVYTGTMPVLLISDPDMIKEIFIKEFQTFTNRVAIFKPDELVADMITTTKDDHWKFIRSTMTPTFTTGKLKNMFPMIQRCCNDLVQNIKSKRNEGKVVEMKELCGCYTMDVICSTAFGLEVNSQKEPNNDFVVNAKNSITNNIVKPYFVAVLVFPFIINILSYFVKPPLFREGAEDFYRNVVKQLIEERKSSNNKKFRDFIQLMLNAHNDSEKGGEITELGAKDFAQYKSRGLSENEILANSIVFLIAGYDTTANTLAFAVYTLATHSDIQDKLIDEIDREVGKNPPTYDSLPTMQYLDMFLSEVLRLYAAAVRINRATKEDITINGIFIPKGTDVSIPISALHRDPKYWPDPEKFDPERFTEENKAKRPQFAYLPFGLGPRVCIGMRLAVSEAKLAIVAMLQNFRFHSCEKTEIPITIEKGFLTRPQNGVHVQVEER